MKRLVCVLLAVLFSMAACAAPAAEPAPQRTDGETPAAAAPADNAGFSSALSDWILGTQYGILSGRLDEPGKTVELDIPAAAMGKLSEQDKRDIEAAVRDMLSLALRSADAAREYSIEFISDGRAAEQTMAPASDTPQYTQGQAEGSVVNLVFIHHSVGENWLRDGLNAALNESGFHVADIYYGWREYGDFTDTVNWPTWFTDGVMSLVYGEMNTMTAGNSIGPAGGENTIVLFKSCFPNSDVGDSTDDEMAIYDGLIPYFEKHPDKMFVLCTPPPMIHIPNPARTRELCDWLADRDAGWLKDLKTGNVFVFDFYNVLTHPDAHHRLADGKEVHEAVEGANELYYKSEDDHPNREGNEKATQEFMGLLNHWYRQFSDSRQ